MARPRHAMRVHPLRTKGVAVGIPVAAAVAFGAHSVLGVTPLSDQQDTSSSTSAAPQAEAPVQAYGLAQAPPPASLGLLAAPVDEPAAAGTATDGTTGSSSGTTTSPLSGATAGKTSTHRIVAPTQTVPIAAAASAPKPSMMTFSGAAEPASSPATAAASAPVQRSAPAETDDEAPRQRAQQEESDQEAAPQQQGGGGALLGFDLGVAKVSVLSFG